MNTKARILLYDIETMPNLSYVWGHYEQNVIAHKKEWELLSVAWKFLGDKEVSFMKRQKNTDKNLAIQLKKLFQESDIVVGHNAIQFDNKKALARMVYHGISPVKPLVTIDTRNVARSAFAFNSNKLDDLGQHLGLGRKVKTPGFDLWLDCIKGDKKALKLMEVYNKRDVELLEKLYNKMRPWIKNHPSIALIESGNKSGCPNCGSSTTRRDGVRGTHATLKQQWECVSCGSYFLTGLKVGAK